MNPGAASATGPAMLVVEAMLDLRHPVKDRASEWAREALGRRDLVEADRSSTFAEDDWQRCADHGILGLLTDADLGGRGGDLATALLTLEGLGHGCRDNGLVYALTSQLLSTQYAIGRFGTPHQRTTWLPDLCAGSKIGAFAMTEPNAGSDFSALETTAVRRDDGSYLLNGHKTLITLAPVCDVVVVFAVTRPDRGRWGITAFVVPTDLPGVERGANREKMGMRTTPFGDLSFRDVELDESMLLGREGSGASVFDATLETERCFVFAPQLGMLERQLDESVERARTRRQGGRPIGEYQAVSNRLADMKVRHESARLFMYKAALHRVMQQPATMAAALAKLVGSHATVDSSLAATLIHGADGYVTEHEVERNVRDAVGGLIYSGTSDVQRNIISGLLGVG